MRADEFSGDGRGMFQRERDSQRQVDEKKIKEGRVKKKRVVSKESVASPCV